MCRIRVKRFWSTVFSILCLVFFISGQGMLKLVSAEPSFNRTEGIVRIGSCEGLKTNVELGLSMDITLTANLICSETIQLSPGQDVTISATDVGHVLFIGEDFSVPDQASSSLFVNPLGASLSLTGIVFDNEAVMQGSLGAVRAIWNAGELRVDGCTFLSLNLASMQDGGAIYNDGEVGEEEGGRLSVSNSSFIGNLAKDFGGAIAAWGEGFVEIDNSTFFSNEAMGITAERRAGSGGAVYASPGTLVSVVSTTFEGCLGRYGGAALFICGGDITKSRFLLNEAETSFGAVVNGDLSEDQRYNASVTFGTPDGENYTCPLLSVSLCTFEENTAVNGYGGAIASVEASLSVFNSSFIETEGGALYFGTSDEEGRDELNLELVSFNQNEGSEDSLDSAGAAFIVELIGLPIDNATVGMGGGSSATVQAFDAPSVVGTGVDLYCFQNEPYECEGYFAQATLALSGELRCRTCEGDAFTGIGSPGGVPTPAPVAVDDDDGLSKMGQERAEGGTLAPTMSGLSGEGGSDSASGTASASPEAKEDSKLLGVEGSDRWVVVGLLAGIGGSLLICVSVLFMCRVRRNPKSIVRKRSLDKDEDLGPAAKVGPTPKVVEASASLGKPPRLPAPSSAFFSLTPRGEATSRKGGSIDSGSSMDLSTPVSGRKGREAARQRAMQRSRDADDRAEAGYRQQEGSRGKSSGPGLVAGASPSSLGSFSSMRSGFLALPDDEVDVEPGYSRSGVGGGLKSRGRSVSQSASTSRSNSAARGRGLDEAVGRRTKSRSATPVQLRDRQQDRVRAVKMLAGGARLPITAPGTSPACSPNMRSQSSMSPGTAAAAAAEAAAAVLPPSWARRRVSYESFADTPDDSGSSSDFPGTQSRDESVESAFFRPDTILRSTSRGRGRLRDPQDHAIGRRRQSSSHSRDWSDETPRGRSGDYPRGRSRVPRSRSRDARGRSGDPLGQSGETRGRSRVARGRSGDPRSRSGDPRSDWGRS